MSKLGYTYTLGRGFLDKCREPFNFVSWQLKLKRWQQEHEQIRTTYVNDARVRKLQIGAGRNILPGWLNTDLRYDVPGVIYLDALRTFPLPENTFEFVYSEHMIEHLTFAQGQTMLKECFRVMKSGGVIRTATPDMARLWPLYNGPLSTEQQQYIRWSIDRHEPGLGVYHGAFAINTFWTSWGHKFIYDLETLTFALTRAGFTDVKQGEVGKSDHEALVGIERHGVELGDETINRFETLIVEARKP